MNTGTCDGVSCTCYIHCNIRNQYTSALYLYVFKDLPPTPRYVRFLNELTCKSVILLSVTIMHIHWFYMCTVCLKRSMHPRFSGQNISYSLQFCTNLWIATPTISLVTGEAVFMDVQHLQNVDQTKWTICTCGFYCVPFDLHISFSDQVVKAHISFTWHRTSNIKTIFSQTL